MNKPRILVLTATGKTGLPTALKLLSEGFPVTALVHREDGRSQGLKAKGADIVVGSMTDLDDLRRAMSGAKRAYFNTPLEPGHLKAASLFATVAAEQELESVVAMSQWLASPHHPSQHTREVWLGDRILERLPVALTTLNPGFFADNDLRPLAFAAQFGLWMMPYGSGLNAPPSNEDLAAVTAEILARPGGHAGKTYRPTGPKLLSPTDIAGVLSRVLGRNVRHVNPPLTMFKKVMKGLGASDYQTAQVEQYLLDYQKGAFAVGGPTQVVRSITGRDPEDFETIARRYADAIAKPRLLTQMQLSASSLRWMLGSSPKTNPYLAKSDFSDQAHVRLSADSPLWQSFHPDPRKTKPTRELA